jgi:hypothetical protein
MKRPSDSDSTQRVGGRMDVSITEEQRGHLGSGACSIRSREGRLRAFDPPPRVLVFKFISDKG